MKPSAHTSEKISAMTEGGKLLGDILESLVHQIAVGVTGLDLEKTAQKMIAATGGSPSFMTVGDYKWATCISVNDGVVHGVPTNKPFGAGDIVSVDVGLLYKGYHTDTSWSVYLPTGEKEKDAEVMRFLDCGEKALRLAIAQATVGHRIGHISGEIQTIVELGGYHVVKSLVGHSIGKTLHEHPQVPGILTKDVAKTPLLAEGMTLAIEVIYAMGKADITYANDDGWSLVTSDGSLAGLFEQTIAIEAGGPVILTRIPN